MKYLVLAVSLLAPLPLAAQTIVVQSGEHDGFTRLVLNDVPDVGWSFGRTKDGYALDLGPKPPGFDLSGIFDLIGKDRISAVWADPVTGFFSLRIACACYAVPYEFRPGILVIDVQAGVAPEGSSFETSLDGAPVAALRAPSPARPRPRPSSLAQAEPVQDLGFQQRSNAFPQRLTFDQSNLRPYFGPEIAVGDGSIDLRNSILRKLSEGAARGIVSLSMPSPAPEAQVQNGTLVSEPNIRIGQDLGLVIVPGGTGASRNGMLPDGRECPTNEELDVNLWGAEPAVSSGIAPALSGILGEFDKPDPAAIERAAKYLINLGFGAEAVQLLGAFRTQVPNRNLLMAMAHSVDGESDPAAEFAMMASCDTNAALWAALSAQDLQAVPDLNTGAVRRGFSALPAHLRRYLGPILSDRFLKLEDSETALAIITAAERGNDGLNPSADLADAKISDALGAADDTDDRLAALAADNGPVAARALVELVESKANQGQAMSMAQVESLGALVQEYRGSAEEMGLRRALSLAQATTGDFDLAFAGAAELDEFPPRIWGLLAEIGSNSAILVHAVPSSDAEIPQALPGDRRRLAQRLIALGLPDPALLWLPEAQEMTVEDRMVEASAHVMRHDGLAALRSLGGLEGAEASDLRRAAFLLIDQPQQALSANSAVADTEIRVGAAMQTSEWGLLLGEGDEDWAQAAALVSDEATQPIESVSATPVENEQPLAGPLESGRTLLQESAAARQTLNQLLASVPNPAGSDAK